MDSHGDHYTASYIVVNTDSYLIASNAQTHTCRMNFSAWLHAQMETAQLTQDDLAQRSGVPQPTINRILTGVTSDPRQSTVQKLSNALGGEWRSPAPDPHNVGPGPDLRGTVPLISWVQAGEFSEAIDLLAPGEGDQIKVTITPRAHTFALRVHGDSMEPDFPAGTVLVVEPEFDALPGDYIIAKFGDEATFKQLVKDSGDLYLKPLNPRYPIKPLGSATIIGVVREAIRKFR